MNDTTYLYTLSVARHIVVDMLSLVIDYVGGRLVGDGANVLAVRLNTERVKSARVQIRDVQSAFAGRQLPIGDQWKAIFGVKIVKHEATGQTVVLHLPPDRDYIVFQAFDLE